MPERLKAILDKITAWWKKFNTKQRSVLISIAAVVIVALVILGVVISRPTQVELVEAQSASEASTIKGVLEDNNISYEVDSKLVFFVNKSDEVNAIMALGDNGIPAQAYSIDNVTDGSFSTTEADKQKKIYAIALGSISNIEDIPVKDIKYVQAKEVIHLRGSVIPIIRLDKMLDIEPKEQEPDHLTVVIVQKGDQQAGLVVDNLIGQQEIVIKSLGKYINGNKLISGATILGDGDVALILDVNTLM